jgi:hypothetical protein
MNGPPLRIAPKVKESYSLEKHIRFVACGILPFFSVDTGQYISNHKNRGKLR